MTEAERRGKQWVQLMSLEKCEGWTHYMAPKIRARMESIRNQLLQDTPAEQTMRLRVEYWTLEGIVTMPENQRAMIEQNSTPE